MFVESHSVMAASKASMKPSAVDLVHRNMSADGDERGVS